MGSKANIIKNEHKGSNKKRHQQSNKKRAKKFQGNSSVYNKVGHLAKDYHNSKGNFKKKTQKYI